jgi:hypothetical protein
VASRDQLTVPIAFWELEDEFRLLLALPFERVLARSLPAEGSEATQLASVELRPFLGRQMRDGSSLLTLISDPEDDRSDGQEQERRSAQQDAR